MCTVSNTFEYRLTLRLSLEYDIEVVAWTESFVTFCLLKLICCVNCLRRAFYYWATLPIILREDINCYEMFVLLESIFVLIC